METVTAKTYTTEDFMNILRRLNCMPYNEFRAMYEKIFNHVSEVYVMEKFDVCRRGADRLICNLDNDVAEQIFDYCLESIKSAN